jgi:hypothetical protein
MAGMAGTEMTPDEWVTRITEAAADRVAWGYAYSLTPRMRTAVADLLHVEWEGHGKSVVCRAIVAEARA